MWGPGGMTPGLLEGALLQAQPCHPTGGGPAPSALPNILGSWEVLHREIS